MNRGVGDILIAVVDGLKGFPETIESVFRRPRFRPASCISSATQCRGAIRGDPVWRSLMVESAPRPAGSTHFLRLLRAYDTCDLQPSALQVVECIGAPDKIRTCDPCLRRTIVESQVTDSTTIEWLDARCIFSTHHNDALPTHTIFTQWSVGVAPCTGPKFGLGAARGASRRCSVPTWISANVAALGQVFRRRNYPVIPGPDSAFLSTPRSR